MPITLAEPIAGPVATAAEIVRFEIDLIDNVARMTFSLRTDGEFSLPTLYSKGEMLSYSVDGNVLTAYVPGDDEEIADRVVFTLTVDPDGGWHFDLDDQLDHVEDGNTEGSQLLSSYGEYQFGIDGIDFSSLIVATDNDGDEAVGAARGSFVITVQYDVPVVVAQPRAISDTV